MWPHFPNFNLPVAISQTKVRNHLRPASLARFIQADIALRLRISRLDKCVASTDAAGIPERINAYFVCLTYPKPHFFVRSLWSSGVLGEIS